MKILYIALIIGLFASCCKEKDEPVVEEKTLPEATQEGKNTIGCYVNGEVWELSEGGMARPLTALRFTDEVFYLHALGKLGDIQLLMSDLDSVGEKSLNDSLNFAVYECGNENCYNDSCCSWVEITKFDTVNYIVSGLFAIQCKNSAGRTYTLKDGRFDVEFEPVFAPYSF